MPDIWYRVEVERRARWDEWYEVVVGYNYSLIWEELTVKHYTPKGVMLLDKYGTEIFVLGKAMRQYAQPTKQLAIADEIARRKRHVSGAKARLTMAEAMLATIEMEKQNGM